jgi:hypothetical protein
MSPSPPGSDNLLVQYMIKYGIPVTRENYIKQNWSPVPDWDAELESELPEFLQDWSRFGHTPAGR